MEAAQAFLSLNLSKMPHRWKSHVAAQTEKMDIDEDGDQDDEGDNVEYSLPAEGKLSESKGVVQKMDFDDNDDDEDSLPAGGKFQNKRCSAENGLWW